MNHVYSRASDNFVMLAVMVAKTFPYVRPLLTNVAECRRQMTITGPVERRAGDPRAALPYTIRGPRPDNTREASLKQAGMKKQASRF